MWKSAGVGIYQLLAQDNLTSKRNACIYVPSTSRTPKLSLAAEFL